MSTLKTPKQTMLDALQKLSQENKLSGMMDLAPEIYHDRLCPGIGSSQLKAVLKSPAHYQELIQNPIEPTPEMIFGTACHSVILEPEIFPLQFTRYPDEPQYSGSGSGHARKKFKEVHPTKTILDNEDYARMNGILKSIYQHPKAPLLLKGLREKTFFWTDEKSKVLCKAKPDNLSEEFKAIVDLKITRDASPEGWKRICASMGYHIQAAFYMDGLNKSGAKAPKIEQFVFVCVENKAPYSIGIYHLDQDSMNLGRKQVERALDVYNQCRSENKWPGYSEEIETLSLPQWIFNLEGEE